MAKCCKLDGKIACGGVSRETTVALTGGRSFVRRDRVRAGGGSWVVAEYGCLAVRGYGAGLRCRVAVQGLGWLSGQGGHAEAMSDKKVTRRRYQTKGHAEARKVRGGLQQLGKETDTELLGG